MERLKDDLLKKSKIIDSSPPINNLNSTNTRIQKIYKFALNPRGGQIEDTQLAQHIKTIFIKTLSFLKRKEQNSRALKQLFMVPRVLLVFVLRRCNIQIDYIVTNGVTQ